MKVLYAMLILVPITLILEFGGIRGHSAVFVASALSLIPLVGVLGRATEEAAIYLEGAELVALYLMLGIAFYFVP